MPNALLNNVRAEFVLGEFNYTSLEGIAQRIREARLVKIHNVLQNVVAEGVLHETMGILGDLRYQICSLLTRRMINAALKDTTAVAVSAHSDAVGTDSIENELRILSNEAIETLLDDMVAIEVLDKLHDFVLQSIDHRLYLLRSGKELDHLLKSPRAMLIERNLNHIRRRVVDQGSALGVVGMFQEFLAEVITKGIGHKLNYMWRSFEKDRLHGLRIASFELLLQVTASVLVFTERVNLTNVLLNLGIRKASTVCQIIS